MGAHNLPETPAHAIANDGVSDLATNGQAQTCIVRSRRNQEQQRTLAKTFAVILDSQEIGPGPQHRDLAEPWPAPFAARGHGPGLFDPGVGMASRTGSGYFELVLTVRDFRPLVRRFLSTLRPAVVDFRLRKPCTFLRRFLCGWYVRFMTTVHLSGRVRALARSPRRRILPTGSHLST